ncbi:IS3 family transposase [Gordonia sp. NB41Y]|uniref:IS3 family transposase n=1 Tax=Gordonia sp. NB41Y TaxID=875808 RepID=UPI00273AC193|nr:IS3 family transposase [Gordonia sp. NB41Y]WLP93169.1 IS3 family transposase [Gordonia sp. NB41Y]
MASGTKRYPADLKRDAVDMVAQLVADGSTEWAAMNKTAGLLGIGSAETVRKWVRNVPEAAAAVSEAAVDGDEVRRLRKENAELKRANGILKAAAKFLRGRDRPATPLIVEFIAAHQGNRVGGDGLVWGVDPMCRVLTEHGLPIAPPTYYEHVNKQPTARMVADAQVIDAIYSLRKEQQLYQVLGSRKMWSKLRSNGIDVARCTVERLMREMGWHGALKKKSPHTTRPNHDHERPEDLVDRRFWAAEPNRLWVADFTYCRIATGWAYTAFVTDVFARKIVGWKVASQMTTDLVTAAIDNATAARMRSGVTDLDGLTHHNDAGSQYTALAFTERLAEAGIAASVGSVGDSYDNALAESVNSDYKNELVDNQPRFPGVTELSLATAQWVAFYNQERPHTYCDDLTPDEAEQFHYDHRRALRPEEALTR